jgi:hypothetical protein
MADICLKVEKFLHRVSADAVEKKDDFIFLDPNACRIDRLPSSILVYTLDHAPCGERTLDRPSVQWPPSAFGVSSPAVFFLAICTPAAIEDGNYQRLEFLGDSILKILTSTALMADHQTWHEGYLSRVKDHIISNGRLAMAAQETALDKYILTKSFTGKKWKPLSNTRLGKSEAVQPRKVSTKTLADIVEAVVGAAFLDGGFPKALSCLKVILPEVSWLPLAERINMLLFAVCDSPRSLTIPPNFMILETLLDHTFTRKHLFSIPSTFPYQCLEYLGDALLDDHHFFSHGPVANSSATPPHAQSAPRPLKKEVQIRHPKEEVGRLAKNKKVGHCIAAPIGD